MKLFLLATGFIFCTHSFAQYPASRVTDSADTWFGKTYPDPYRWMEHLKNQETIDWFKAQNEYTASVIKSMPLVETLFNENKEADKIRSIKYNAIYRRGNDYFFDKRLPGQQRFRIFMRKGNTEPTELFNPEIYAEGKYELTGWSVSDDAKNILLNMSEPGKESGTIYLMDVQTKQMSADTITNANNAYWLPNRNMFFYTKTGSSDVHSMDATLNSKLMLYNRGKRIEMLSNTHDPSLNILPEEYPFISVFENGNYIIAGKGTVENNQELYFAPVSELMSGKINWKPFCSRADKITQAYVRGNDIFVLGSKKNSRFDVWKYSIRNGQKQKPVLVYSPGKDVVQGIAGSKSFIYIYSLESGIKTRIQKLPLAGGKLSEVKVPLEGLVYAYPYDEKSDDLQVSNTGWTKPFNRYEYNVATGSFAKSYFYTPLKVEGIENIEAIETEVVSHDGTKIPLSIVYDNTMLKKDGSNICYLDGYGAYGSITSPYWSFVNLSMLKRGVVLAYAHIRGGGEEGEEWHLAGYKTTKPNTWKDFIACADYLVNKKYTSSQSLAGTGTSAGGILIGRAITERPELFRVAVPRVGCLNTLRLEFSPNGPVNVPEFGTVKIEEQAKALAEMDAVRHVKKGVKYPAMLITTGFNDPRVISWSPGKFAAAVQNNTGSGLPALLKVNYAGGHFGGANNDEWLKDDAIEKAFILWQCGYKGK
ncbi:MAG: prolyl oligopeptidase family serine peptidase [Ferruginibacter sp.]